MVDLSERDESLNTSEMANSRYGAYAWRVGSPTHTESSQIINSLPDEKSICYQENSILETEELKSLADDGNRFTFQADNSAEIKNSKTSNALDAMRFTFQGELSVEGKTPTKMAECNIEYDSGAEATISNKVETADSSNQSDQD